MRPLLIRQRPGIGDALLLSALIREFKGGVEVWTDATYANGALVDTFKGIPGVRSVTSIPMTMATTDSNRAVDSTLRHTPPLPPPRGRQQVFDCNGGFMAYEREHGGYPPLGIAAFWLYNFGIKIDGQDLRPRFNVPVASEQELDDWLTNDGKPILGVVMRAGHYVRDWAYNGRATLVMDWAHSMGYHPVSIDSLKVTNSSYGQACVGQSIPFTAALLKRCKVVLTPDTGILHLAEAVGTRTVSLWGKVHPNLRVAGYNTRVIPPEPLPSCLPDIHCPCCSWAFQHYSCLRTLNIQQILAAVQEEMAR